MKKTLAKFIIVLVMIPTNLFADTLLVHCRDYPPELIFEDGICIGPVPDMVSDILAELGHKIEWVNMPWIRSYHDAKLGKVDLLIRHSMTEERKSVLHAITYGSFNRRVFFYKSPMFEPDIKSYADLKNVYIGAIRGNFYSPQFSKIDMSKLLLVGSTEQLVGMLELGRIDVAITSESHNKEFFASRFEKATFVDTFPNAEYISIPLKSDAIKHQKKISDLVKKYRETGKINHYFERYGFRVPNKIKPRD